LFEGLKTIKTNNAQGEYYLPDVIPFIRERGYRVKSLLLENPIEGSGINSPEELSRIQEYLNSTAK
jgi:bifunctional UDP-N-acetylglucosamine pyrophosphorylase/glucosamine-1-phosphate N-acetyltransferase